MVRLLKWYGAKLDISRTCDVAMSAKRSPGHQCLLRAVRLFGGCGADFVVCGGYSKVEMCCSLCAAKLGLVPCVIRSLVDFETIVYLCANEWTIAIVVLLAKTIGYHLQ